MSVETALYAALKNLAPTFPTLAPQGTTALPRITYQRVAGGDASTYAGDGMGATNVRVQVDVWASDYPAARKLSDQARAALYAALAVGQVTDNPSDYESDTKLHRASFDVEAWE
ncbi:MULTISPECIES: tail completion protein gp17 [Luteibacter]|uniref:tail completion protein gp17 n=1 Tax=Luteibacter TaxID=242605 RepID=UPI00056B629F|nr:MULTISPECIES: DUF3168 domain-containing protein [unclassified Luteibacter]